VFGETMGTMIYEVQSGNLLWRGDARSMDKALEAAYRSGTRNTELAILTRFRTPAKVWMYIDTSAKLKQFGLQEP
jgi:hypothetical protein